MVHKSGAEARPQWGALVPTPNLAHNIHIQFARLESPDLGIVCRQGKGRTVMPGRDTRLPSTH